MKYHIIPTYDPKYRVVVSFDGDARRFRVGISVEAPAVGQSPSSEKMSNLPNEGEFETIAALRSGISDLAPLPQDIVNALEFSVKHPESVGSVMQRIDHRNNVIQETSYTVWNSQKSQRGFTDNNITVHFNSEDKMYYAYFNSEDGSFPVFPKNGDKFKVTSIPEIREILAGQKIELTPSVEASLIYDATLPTRQQRCEHMSTQEREAARATDRSMLPWKSKKKIEEVSR